MVTRTNVKTEGAVFEDLIADFIIEEGREPAIDEMAYFARRITRSISMGEFYAD